MTAYEMIQKLAQYPADTKLVLGFDWGEPVLDDAFLVLEKDPCLNITNTADSKERHSAALSERDEAVAARAREMVA